MYRGCEYIILTIVSCLKEQRTKGARGCSIEDFDFNLDSVPAEDFEGEKKSINLSQSLLFLCKMKLIIYT